MPRVNYRDFYSQDEVVALSVAASRLALARALQGVTAYEGDRDYYEVLGYPADITIAEYAQRYERQDIASRIVDLPAVDTWKNPPKISEAGETNTPFVAGFEALNKRLKIWNALTRADMISGIGRFGILLIGLKDGRKLSQPVDLEALTSETDVIYLRPFSEVAVSVKDDEKDIASPRYGMPISYSIAFGGSQGSQVVHWSRVIHVAEGKRDSEVYGTPRLKSVFNRLDDLMKVVGGTAEATWLNMRPGVAVGPKDGYDWGDTDAEKEAWLTEVQRYAHDPLRILRLIGGQIDQIGTPVINDPSGPYDVIISQIAASTGIPKRKLLGSAQGELSASKEDTRQWAQTIRSRQQNYAEPDMLRPTIDRLVWYGVIPAPTAGPETYDVGTLDANGKYTWPSIIELSELEMAEERNTSANAVKALADPTTFTLPITLEEQRELLGYPPRARERGGVAAQPPLEDSIEALLAIVGRGDVTAQEVIEQLHPSGNGAGGS